jgi:hypothetical protein
MRKEDLQFVDKLIKVLVEAELKLEKYYQKRDINSFNEIKKFILTIQKEIEGALE